MANIEVRDGANLQKYVKADGTGTNLDPFIPHHKSNLMVGGADVGAGNPISVAMIGALPLPTGAATEATLAAFSAKFGALGQAAMAGSAPVVIASNQSAIPVTGTFFQATQPVSGTFWQATQPISAVALPLPTGAATSANQTSGTQISKIGDGVDTVGISTVGAAKALKVDVVQTTGSGGGLSVIDKTAFVEGTSPLTPVGGCFNDALGGDLAEDEHGMVRLTAKRAMHVNLRKNDGTELSAFPVMGTFWQATQPVSGTVTANQGTAAAGAGAWPVAITNTADTIVKPGDAALNAIRVNIVAGAGSGGTALADKAAFVEGATSTTPISGVFNDALGGDLAEDTAGAIRVTAKRAMHVNLRDVAGAELTSFPVTGTFWQATQPISAAALPLPAGASTSALQTTGNTSLGNIDTKLPAILGQKLMAASLAVVLASDQSSIPVTGTFWQATQPVSGTFWQATQPISAAALPLPTGAATSALQTTGNTSLGNIDTKLPVSVGQKVMAGSLAVVIASDQSAIPVSGGGLSVVDTTTFTPAVSSDVPVGGLAQTGVPASILDGKSGAFAMSLRRALHVILRKDDGANLIGQNLMANSIPVVIASDQSTQLGVAVDRSAFVAGTTTFNPGGGVYNDGLAVVASGTQASFRITQNRGLHTNLRTDAGIELVGQQLMATSLPVAIASNQSALPVTGTFWQATQPVSGTFWQATQPISATALPLPTGASTSALQTTGNTSLGNIDTKTPALGQALMAASTPVVIASNQSAVPVSGTFWQATQPVSGTFWQATQPVSISSNIGTRFDYADRSAFTDGTSNAAVIAGVFNDTPSDPTEDTAGAVRITAKRALHVNLRNNAGTEITSFGGTAQTDRSAFTDGAGQANPIAGVYNETQSDPTEDQAAAVRITAKRAIHVNLRTAAAAELLGQQTKAASIPVTIASDQGGSPTAGDVAHGTGDSGNPVKVGGQARTTNQTAEADGDRVNWIGDVLGKQVVRLNAVRGLVVQAAVTRTVTTEATLLGAGAAGVFHDVTKLIMTNSSATATRVQIRDATAGSIVLEVALAAFGGAVIDFAGTPFTQTTAANNWTIGLATAVTSVYCFIQAVKNTG